MDPRLQVSTIFSTGVETLWGKVNQHKEAAQSSKNILSRMVDAMFRTRFLDLPEVRSSLEGMRSALNSSPGEKNEIIRSIVEKSFRGERKLPGCLYDKLGEVVTYLQQQGAGKVVTEPLCEVIRQVFGRFKARLQQDGVDELSELMQELTVSKKESSLDFASQPRIAQVLAEKEEVVSSAILAAQQKDVTLSMPQVDGVRSLVRELKVGINEVAIRELFDALRKNPVVSEKVVAMIEDDWNGRGEIIGTAIKANTKVLTRERRDAIIRKAEDSSFKAEFGDSISDISQKMKQDLREGKVVITSKLEQKYSDFYKLQQSDELTNEQKIVWARNFQQIVRDAYLFQEITSLQKNKRNSSSFVEDTILRGMGITVKDETRVRICRADAEVRVMRMLMEGEGFNSQTLEEFAEYVRTKKLEASLKSVGVSEKKAADLACVIPLIQQQLADLHAKLRGQCDRIAGLRADFPPLATRWLLSLKKSWLANKLDEMYKEYINMQPDFLRKKVWNSDDLVGMAFPEEFAKSIDDGTFSTTYDEELLQYGRFYEKWGPRIVREMIQGLDDDDAIFHGGACLGISTEWVLKEVHSPFLSAEEFVRTAKVGDVSSTQRFRQLEHLLRNKTAQSFAADALFWNRQLLKQQNIEMIVPIAVISDESIDNQVKQLQECLAKQSEALRCSHGVVLLFIKEHAIYMRMDETGTHRLGDPNVGVLDFSKSNDPKSELFACLKDLLSSHYKKNDHIFGYQFIPIPKGEPLVE